MLSLSEEHKRPSWKHTNPLSHARRKKATDGKKERGPPGPKKKEGSSRKNREEFHMIVWLRWWFHWRHISHAKQTAIYWWVYCNHFRGHGSRRNWGEDCRMMLDDVYVVASASSSVDSLYYFLFFVSTAGDTICKFRFMTTRAT